MYSSPVRALAADLGDGADDLVAGDDRERRRGLRRRAAILGRLAAPGVLVGAADAAHLERDDHRVVADLRIGKVLVSIRPGAAITAALTLFGRIPAFPRFAADRGDFALLMRRNGEIEGFVGWGGTRI